MSSNSTSPARDRGFKYFHYDPSAEAALLFTAIFGISTLLHLYQMVRTRTWFVTPFVIGGILSIIGYAARYICTTQTPDWTLGPYIGSTLGLLLAPALYAATIYMELKRVITAIKAEHLSPVKIRWLTVLFVSGDVLSFLAQGLGGSLLARRDPKLFETGENIIVGGLFIQLIFFALFFVTSLLVHIRVRKNPTALSELSSVPWRKHMFCLYFMSILIFVRSIFRVIEYLQGYNGFLLGHEVFLYIFDATLMTFVTYALNIVHPSEIDALTHGGLVSRRAGLKHEWVNAVDEKRTDQFAGRGTELSSLDNQGYNRTV